MTTIAYRDGIMAADSAAVADDTIIGDAIKVHRTARGLVGCCGNIASAHKFVDWWAGGEGGEPSEADEGVGAITVDRNGEILIWNSSAEPQRISAPFYAIGSGFQLAIGAMAAGASAAEAVRIACRYDMQSGGAVITRALGGDDGE